MHGMYITSQLKLFGVHSAYTRSLFRTFGVHSAYMRQENTPCLHLVWRSHTLSVKRGEGLVCLVVQKECNLIVILPVRRAQRMQLAQAQQQISATACVYMYSIRSYSLHLFLQSLVAKGNTYSLTGLTNSIVLSESRGRSATAILLT